MRPREAIEGRTVKQLDLKIPSGRNCLSCNAKGCLRYHHSTAVKRDVCLLYGMKLNTHPRRISGTRDPWGHNETADVVEKCEPCRQGVDPVEFRKEGARHD